LYLTDEWPNPAVVSHLPTVQSLVLTEVEPCVQRDAYYHPAVDESEEPFKWGLPDLDGLQQYVNANMSSALVTTITPDSFVRS
jgi:DNA excision repair protein ERCC-5